MKYLVQANIIITVEMV